MSKCEIEKIKGSKIHIDLPEDLTKYALNFLALYNNFKNNKDIHYIRNGKDNDVVIAVAYEHGSEPFKMCLDWLETLGAVTNSYSCNIYQAYIDDEQIDHDIMNEIDCELSLKNEWY